MAPDSRLALFGSPRTYTPALFQVAFARPRQDTKGEVPQRQPLYTPIGKATHDIRLIYLQPSQSPNSPISCKLFLASLDDPEIEFEALSYTWGPRPPPSVALPTIIVNGLIIPVRRNLFDALNHLRGPWERVLWIDALCIDQDNVLERNHQVQQMRAIYERAWRVVIWLGLESEESGLALRFIDFVGKHCKGGCLDVLESFKEVGFKRELEAVRKLCARPYWNRLWIIQEVVVARKARLQCGNEYTTWERFSTFQELFDELPGPFHTQFELLNESEAFGLGQYRNLYKINDSRLEGLLKTFQKSSCEDPRDKIYGLVGLASDAEDLMVDYGKSLFEVFLDAVWGQRYRDCCLIVEFAQFLHRLFQGSVSGNSKRRLKSKDGEHDLVGALGYETGVVEGFGPLYEDVLKADKEEREEMMEKLLRNANSGKNYHLSILLSDAAKIAIPKKVSSIQSPMSHGMKGGMEYLEYRKKRWGLDENIEGPSEKEAWGQLTPTLLKYRTPKKYYKDRMKISRSQFFIDDRGFLGVGPSTAKAGDAIARFAGSDVAAVLRWSFDRYMFVGRAVFPRRRGEGNDLLWQEDDEVWHVTRREEIRDLRTVSLWMDGETLRLLTQ